MDTILLILALIVLACLLYSRRTNRHSRNYHPRWTPPQCDAATQEQSNASAASQADTDMLPYDKAYQRKWLLTMNEKVFYRQLCTFAAKKNMTVFTKVRLLDLLEPVKNQPKYKTYFYKVQAKHVDFVLCDSKLVARYIIELDDNSHNTQDRAERDRFVDLVLQAVGYKVLRLNAFDEAKIEQAFFQPAT